MVPKNFWWRFLSISAMLHTELRSNAFVSKFLENCYIHSNVACVDLCSSYRNIFFASTSFSFWFSFYWLLWCYISLSLKMTAENFHLNCFLFNFFLFFNWIQVEEKLAWRKEKRVDGKWMKERGWHKHTFILIIQ